ncbi:hypothetical protein GCM10017691_29610 [Pseudonocardia petroleophila]|uniref:Uncharacterized protein n=1 Tax=Pseudonocardia petroleophila TaxID=37331 RepID=A0A7G7MEG5_9PSEU|nr:hypothetical protein [Pseudonocardia petroleophila]QNG51176.1 hypothetical protein H6H00_23890 [Pseudonocardia petroleophila]
MTHLWFTISRHLTSEGLVSYQRCPCGRWRTLQDGDPLTRPAGHCSIGVTRGGGVPVRT